MFNLLTKQKSHMMDHQHSEEIEELHKQMECDGHNHEIEGFSKKNQDVVVEEIGDFFKEEDQELMEQDDDDPEMEDYDQDFDEEEEETVKNAYFGNYSAMNFVASKMKCHLDDLSELLGHSEKYNTALAQIEESGDKYHDPEFNPDANSVCGYSIDFNRRGQVSGLEWKRSDEYFEGDVCVYDSLDSGDIMQGQLGDCYFLAAISSIAEHPERLARIFLTKENEGNGLFAVALCLNGVWEDVILDDHAPCNANGKLDFNTSKTNELWVVLLEKAWAKVHGGYLNIEAGLTREALRDLTGASAKTFFTQQRPEELWNTLMDAERKQFIMAAGSDDLSSGSDAYIQKIGICGSHAYSLLAVYELKEEGGDHCVVEPGEDYAVRLVKLRNPWGSGEWQGEWGDEDERWTHHLKEELGFTGKKEDGIFFIPWEEFLKYYSDVQICYYHDGYKYSAEKLESQRNETVFMKFTIKSEGLFYFSVNQRNRRFYAQNAGYKYSQLGWVLGKIDGEDSVFMGSGLKADKENWQAIQCEPGEYYAMVHTPWRSVSREFSYSVYGPEFTDIEKVEEGDLPENFINEIFISKAKSELEEKGGDFAHRKHPGIKYVSSEHNGWAYVYFENNEEEHQISVTLNFGDSYSGVRVLPPHSGNKPTFTVGPGEQEIVVYKNNGRKRSSVSMMTAFRRMAKIDNIKDKVRASTTILKKRHNGEEVDIRVHFYYHAPGIALLYVNETDDLTLNENLEFNLDNAHIEGVTGNAMSVSLGPGKEKLIKVIRNDEEPFQARLASIMYTISQKSSIYSKNKWW